MSAPTTVHDRPSLTAVRAGWLFNGTGSDLLADPMILFDGESILAVEHGGTPPEGATVVDLDGATLLPGLVDTHVHLAFDSTPDAVGQLAERDDVAALAAMGQAARAALRGGVTTVRDLGDRGYLSLKLRDSGAPDLPTILAAGPPITTPAGHCHFLGGVADPGEDGIRTAVREHFERGVDVIKFMASGGSMTPGTRQELAQFALEVLRAGVEEAHRLGLPVTAHAHGTPAIADAVAARVDGMEHVSFWSTDGVDDPPEDLVAAIARERIAVGVTAGIVPIPGLRPPPEILKRMPRLFANIRYLHDSGVRIVIGTDAGIAPVKPPDVLRHAVVQLPDVGFGAAEALRTVTSEAADVLGLGHRKGRIAPGFDADLIAIDGDPLADLGAVHRLRAVYARGVAVR